MMIELGHYKIRGSMHDQKRYRIYGDSLDSGMIKLQIEDRQNAVSHFAMKFTGIGGMKMRYDTQNLPKFVAWQIHPDKINEFLATFYNYMCETYPSCRIFLNQKEIKTIRILTKL